MLNYPTAKLDILFDSIRLLSLLLWIRLLNYLLNVLINFAMMMLI